MNTTTAIRSHDAGRARPAAISPSKVVLKLLPVGIAAMLVIDWMLGDAAEYFHALRLVEAWGQVIADGGIEVGHEFIAGQDSMGNPLALAVGTGLLIVEPAVGLALIVYPAMWVARRVRGRG